MQDQKTKEQIDSLHDLLISVQERLKRVESKMAILGSETSDADYELLRHQLRVTQEELESLRTRQSRIEKFASSSYPDMTRFLGDISGENKDFQEDIPTNPGKKPIK